MMKRIFHCNNGAWRSFLRFSLEPFGGLLLFLCNYDIEEIHIFSKFYSELLQWWSEFRSVFDSRREFQYILWSNKEISVDNKPVFYKKKKKISEQDIIFVNDLLFELDTTNSFTIVSNKISKINYLIWAGLCLSVPNHLKNSNCHCSELSLILTMDNKEFNILKKKSPSPPPPKCGAWSQAQTSDQRCGSPVFNNKLFPVHRGKWQNLTLPKC